MDMVFPIFHTPVIPIYQPQTPPHTHFVRGRVECDTHKSLTVTYIILRLNRTGGGGGIIESEMQKLEKKIPEKQNFRQQAKHVRLYCGLLQAYKRGPVIALGSQQKGHTLLCLPYPFARVELTMLKRTKTGEESDCRTDKIKD